MPLDPQVKEVLDQMAAMQMPALSSLPPEQGRQMIVEFTKASGPGEDVAEVEDIQIPTPDGPVPARVYTPEGTGPFPVVAYFHGGGWVLGSIETHDGSCRALANRAGSLVVSVDYRLAPEHTWPAAPNDCFAATQWLAEHAGDLGGDPSRLAVAGDSAGGNLAAVVALMARDAGGPPLRFQLLIYPAVDARMKWESIDENATGYFLTKADMEWFYGHYSALDPSDWRVSPYLASDLSNLPPALVITAEFDPLRDEGEAYAKRLEEAGVPVTLTRYDGQIHGFFGMTAALEGAVRAVDQAGSVLKEHLG